MSTTHGTAHYAHIRCLGMNGRIVRENEAPLRLIDGKVGTRVKGFILPVVEIDDDGYALVDITNKAGTALAETPRTDEGGWDYQALQAHYPPITDPWSVKALAGLATRGNPPAPKGSKKASKGKALTAGKTATKAPKPRSAPKEAPAMTQEMVINYLAGLTPAQNAELVEQLAKSQSGK